MNWNTMNDRFAERAGARSCSQSLLDLLVPIILAENDTSLRDCGSHSFRPRFRSIRGWSRSPRIDFVEIIRNDAQGNTNSCSGNGKRRRRSLHR